jgi:hypothetical protein
MHYVLVLMAVALVAILAAIVFVAIGRGGEMAQFPNDYAPPEFGALAATDVALLKPPTALWGYHMQATDEALNRIALAISDRDVRIASLERQLADLRAGAAVPGAVRQPGPYPPAGSQWPGAVPGAGTPTATATGERTAPGGPAAAAPGSQARHARPAQPERTGGAERTSGAGAAGTAGNAHDPANPRTSGGAASGEDGANGGPGHSGTGWPDDANRPVSAAPAGENSAGGPGPGPAHDSGTAWPGWPGTAAEPQPHRETQPSPRSHPQPGAPGRPQPDEEETW